MIMCLFSPGNPLPNHVELIQKAVRSVLTDESFTVPSPHTEAAISCGNTLMSHWIEKRETINSFQACSKRSGRSGLGLSTFCQPLQARSQDLCMGGSILCAHRRVKFFATTPTLVGHAHQINSAKATKKCVPSGRTSDVLVAKSVILEFERSNTVSAEP